MRSPLRLMAFAVAFVGAAVFCLALGVSALTGRGLLGGLGAIGPLLAPSGGADLGAGGAPSGPPSAAAIDRVPPGMLLLYEQAAPTCPGLPWTVLAAIGTVESSNGTSNLPGVHSGSNYAGAQGPMQFEPGTFAEYDHPVAPGGAEPPNPYDAVDAVYAAARLLCANGAAGGADIERAVFAYNHSQSYVTEVMSLARNYAMADS